MSIYQKAQSRLVFLAFLGNKRQLRPLGFDLIQIQDLAQNHLPAQAKKRLDPFLVRTPRSGCIILHYFAAGKAYPLFFGTFPHPFRPLRISVDFRRIQQHSNLLSFNLHLHCHEYCPPQSTA